MRTAKADLLAFAPATAQKNINLDILMQVLIPLPPLAEQHRIVAKVDELTGHGHASINRLHYQEGEFALGTILAAVVPFAPDLISARFLFEYLSTFKEELLVTRMTGTANVTLSIGRIAEVPVPLAPPSAQRKVDELMALCDQLEAACAEREMGRGRFMLSTLAKLNEPDPEIPIYQK